MLLLLCGLLPGVLSYTVQPSWSRPLRPVATVRSAPVTAALAAEPETDSVLGEVSVCTGSGMLVIEPERRAEAKVGSLLAFGGGATGVILFERCGYYFAAALNGEVPVKSESVRLLPASLTIPGWSEDDAWGGVCDCLLQDGDLQPITAEALVARAKEENKAVPVFGETVPASGRRPIGKPLHTGVVAIDALTPIGRGQSMAVFGPNGLPSGAGRTDVGMRIVEAQHLLQSGVKSVLVLSGEGREEEREAIVAQLRASGALDVVRVFTTDSATEAYIAASAACSFAEVGPPRPA